MVPPTLVSISDFVIEIEATYIYEGRGDTGRYLYRVGKKSDGIRTSQTSHLPQGPIYYIVKIDIAPLFQK